MHKHKISIHIGIHLTFDSLVFVYKVSCLHIVPTTKAIISICCYTFAFISFFFFLPVLSFSLERHFFACPSHFVFPFLELRLVYIKSWNPSFHNINNTYTQHSHTSAEHMVCLCVLSWICIFINLFMRNI